MKTNFEVFNDELEAKEDGCLWGVDMIYLSEEHINLLREGKVLKTDNGEYVQIISMEGGAE